MCLIEEVVSWDGDSILCRTRSHLSGSNPLRRYGRLAGVHAIEYAGQAAALHGSLSGSYAEAGEHPAMLAAVRDVHLYADDLGRIREPLVIYARRLLQTGPNAIYGFQVDGGGWPVCSGRMTVMSGGGLSG